MVASNSVNDLLIRSDQYASNNKGVFIDPSTPVAKRTESLMNITRSLSQCHKESAPEPIIRLLIEHTVTSACSLISLYLDQEKCLMRMEMLRSGLRDTAEDLEHCVALLRDDISTSSGSLSGSPYQKTMVETVTSLETWIGESREFFSENAYLGRSTSSFRSEASRENEAVASRINLRVYLFGNFEVKENSRIIRKWPKGKAKQIFKYLAYTSKAVQKEILMDMFWPHHSVESARNNLNVAIYSIRKALKIEGKKVPLIVYNDGCYRFNSKVDLWVDTTHFENQYHCVMQLLSKDRDPGKSLERLQALYRGDFFSDDLYCEWAAEIRESFREKFLEALRSISNFYYRQGDFDACIEVSQRLTVMDCCDECACQMLMSCYGKKGLRHLALKQYEALKKSLHDELNLSPGKDTEKILCRVRNNSACW